MAPMIEARGLEKRYGRTTALAGLALVAEPGQVVAVLGPSRIGLWEAIRALVALPLAVARYRRS